MTAGGDQDAPHIHSAIPNRVHVASAVGTCRSAAEFDALLLRTPLDAALVDIMLPGEDGLSICRRLRAANDLTPIIMLTTEDNAQIRERGKAAGVNGWIVKPFRGEAVLGPFKKFCGME